MQSYAFRQALGGSTGAPVSPGHARGVPAELLALPQADRVRALAKPIAALFQQLDSGRVSLDAFRAGLSDLGVAESPEATRLLSQGGAPSFTALFRALQVDVAESGAAGAASAAAAATAPTGSAGSPRPFGPLGGAPTAGGRVLGPRPGERQLDPVSWTGDAAVVGPGHADRAAVVSPFNTALVGNILAAPATVGYRSKGREVTAHLHAETGAGAVLRNEPGPLPPGVEHGVYAQAGGGGGDAWRADPRLNRMGAGPRALAELHGRGAAALVAPAPPPPHGAGASATQQLHHGLDAGEHRFQSHSQAAQSRGLLGGRARGAEERGQGLPPPPTSAGYGAAGGGPPSRVRESVHELLRALDAGRVSAAGFRAQLADLGVPAAQLPPTLERMLADATRFGTRIDFGRAARSFEDFFAAQQQQQQQQQLSQLQPPKPAVAAPATAAEDALAHSRGDPYQHGTEPASGAGGLAGGGCDGAGGGGGGGGGGGVTRAQMLLRGGDRGLAEPVRPVGYVASLDEPTFTRNRAIGGKFYSPHIPAGYKSHGDIVGWQGETTARECPAGVRLRRGVARWEGRS